MTGQLCVILDRVEYNKCTAKGNFLTIDSSVFNVTTPDDPDLPRDLVLDKDGTSRFAKYLPKDRAFVNTIEDYPYPYVIGRLCWEFPCATPSDWLAQHLHGPNNPATVRDWKALLDATVIKQGVFCLVFHPHGWISNEQIVDLIDYTDKKYGKKVKFLNFRECQERLNKNVLGGQPLRDPKHGWDNGVRLLDVNNDGFMDVVVGSLRQTRIWSPEHRLWISSGFPAPLLRFLSWELQGELVGIPTDGNLRFGIFREEAKASVLSFFDRSKPQVWHFDGNRWIADPDMGKTLKPNGLDCKEPQLWFGDMGVRLRDLDGDGQCELIVSNAGMNAVFAWDTKKKRWHQLPFRLPEGSGVIEKGQDAGVRFVDLVLL